MIDRKEDGAMEWSFSGKDTAGRELVRFGGEIRFSGITGSPRRVLQMSNVISLICEEG
ncbi:MAG TPA: hypothetical protein VMV90_07435 [Rectinemataceae bacterium]|nr:hypothetical protein [Rectinemataceae bacterium]